MKYALSFTTGALLAREALIAVPVYLNENDWNVVRRVIEEDNLFQSRTMASRRRTARETVQRLATLSEREIKFLIDATAGERGHLLWIAACRHYGLVGDFAEEVVRERFLVGALTLQYEDFDRFVRSKALWHGELENMRDSTFRKLRSNLFRMLSQADLLSENGNIITTVVSEPIIALLNGQTPSDMRFFPTRDTA